MNEKAHETEQAKRAEQTNGKGTTHGSDDQGARNLADRVLALVRLEPDRGARMAALVAALAASSVDYSHQGLNLVLDQVVQTRDKLNRRLNHALSAAVLDRIARDQHTIAIAVEDPLDSLLAALDPGPQVRRTRPKDMKSAIAEALGRAAREDSGQAN